MPEQSFSTMIIPSHCPKCRVETLGQSECPHCGVIFARLHPPVTRPDLAPSPDLAPRLEEPNRVSFKSLAINGASYPLAFGFAWLVNQVPVLGGLSWYVVSTPIHEWGHALHAWMGGMIAIPIFLPGVGFTSTFGGRHFAVFLLFAAFNLGLALYTWSSRFYAWALLSLLLFGAQVVCTFLISKSTLDWLVIFGGCGGAIYFSALLCWLFYHPAPDRWRWDFVRFVFLFFGALCFVQQFELWQKASHDVAFIPWGSAVTSERGDAHGDMQRLVASGWKDVELAATYYKIAKICAMGLIGQFLVGLLLPYTPRRDQSCKE